MVYLNLMPEGLFCLDIKIAVTLCIYFLVINFMLNIKKLEVDYLELFGLFLIILKFTFIAFALCNSIFEFLDLNFVVNSISLNMSDNSSPTIRKTEIIHNGNWSDTISSIVIWGSAAVSLRFSRTAGQRFGSMATAMATESFRKIVNNIINDPNYVKDHWNSWNTVYNEATRTVTCDVTKDIEALEALKQVKAENPELPLVYAPDTNNFLPSDFSFFGDSSFSLSDFISIFKPLIDWAISLIDPVSVDYPVSVLAEQLYFISIALFFMCLGITLLFVFFFINVLTVIFRDRLANYFKNKYIVTYLNISKYLLIVELVSLFFLILFFLLNLAYGLHFLATHPIKIPD